MGAVGAGSPEAVLAPERRAEILRQIRRDKSVLVKDLCAQFGVSGETIRKDLSLLEREGHLIKTYGGAYVQEGVRNSVDASIRKVLLPDAKEAIGAACAELVDNGDAVFLDESTTCLSVARRLVNKDITVITNALEIVEVFSPAGPVRVVGAGGEFDRKNRCFVGGCTEEFLRRFNVDKSFVSCRGADRARGFTDGNPQNGRIRAMMLAQAKHPYLILDHTKLDQVNYFKIGDYGDIEALVIDYFPTQEWPEFLNEKGVRAIQANPDQEARQ